MTVVANGFVFYSETCREVLYVSTGVMDTVGCEVCPNGCVTLVIYVIVKGLGGMLYQE